MKRLILLLLLSFTLTGVAVRADLDPSKEFGDPSQERADLVHRIGRIRQDYWEAYKKGGADFEAARLQLSSALFYRDVFLMLSDSQSRMPDIFRSNEERAANIWWDLLGTMTNA